MRVLLITYEFSPIESAQALRWQYLSRHLLARGVQVTVIAPEVIKGMVADDIDDAKVIRSFPGPFVGMSGWLSRQSGGGYSKIQNRTEPIEENRAELVYRKLRRGLDKIIFPDVRSEWYPFAARSFAHFAPGDVDLVIASHEPGVDLMLGMSASKKLKAPLVIDLADPLVTPYSPSWRRRWDKALERKASKFAAGVITTSKRFSRDLIEQHGLKKDQVIQIEQGFEPIHHDCSSSTDCLALPKNQFWLLYTGNFYRDFRNPAVLLKALVQRPDIKFLFAGNPPGWLLEMFKPLGGQVRCLGRLSHGEAISIQRRAPVLFNLGNQQAKQVPGKLFEYFGAGRPIFHIALNPDDPSGALLEDLRRGIGTSDDVDQIIDALDRMQDVFSRKAMSVEWDLGLEAVAEYSWKSLSLRLMAFLETCVAK